MSRSIPVAPEPPLRRWGGLLVRRSGWKLSLGGWLLLLALMVGFAGGFLLGIHPFLAVTHPLRGPILVVEGWSPNFAMPQVAAEYAAGGYQQVLVVRGIYETGDVYDSGRYSGEYLTNLLAQQGIPRERLTALFPPVVRRDRTYHSALAVKAWLAQQGLAVDSLDVATVGAHARRSRLLYQKAMGKEWRVGIIALEDKQYDPRHWWRSSEGVREVLGESIAYIYARCFFRAPNESGSRAKAEPSRPPTSQSCQQTELHNLPNADRMHSAVSPGSSGLTKTAAVTGARALARCRVIWPAGIEAASTLRSSGKGKSATVLVDLL